MAIGDAEPLPSAEQLAHSLHAAIMETNRLLGDIKELLDAGAQRQERLAEVMDEACDYMEIAVTAADILDDIAGNGKSLTSKDIVKAIQAATKEVFGDEDDDEGKNGGGEGEPDPAGGEGRRRVRRS